MALADRPLAAADPPVDRLSCLAPQMAMRFSPNGEVHACCVNSTYALGHVGRDRLIDIWNGQRLAALRRAVDAGDGTLGCQDCEFEHVRGRKDVTHAALYEYWADLLPTEWPVRLEFALTNTCNLTCIHCNGELSSAIRSRREHLEPLPDHYGEQFFADIVPFLEHVRVTSFLGGEPFLMRPVRRVWDLLLEHGRDDVEVHLTTNGTVWNDRVEHYVRGLRMNVAVSIDGVTAETFERIREGASFEEVCRNRDRLFRMTREHGGSFSINHCLLRQNAHELYDFLRDADDRGMRVEVIPVWFPGRHSVFSATPEELTELVEHLRRRERESGSLGGNAAQWDTAMGHLEASIREQQVGGLEALRSVPVSFPQRRPVLLEESFRRQREFGGAEPLRVEVLGRTIDSVEVPDWAASLHPEEWVGEPEDAILEGLAASLGGDPRWEVRRLWEQLTEVDVTIEGPTGATTLRVHLLSLEDDERRTLLIASPVLVEALAEAQLRVDAVSAGTATEEALAVAAPVRLPQRLPAVLGESLRQQTEHGGAEPLVLELVDDVVTAVEEPDWATPLAAADWIGATEEQLLERISERFGGEPSWNVTRLWEQLTEVDLAVGPPDDRLALRIHVVEWIGEGTSCRRILLASPQLVGLAQAGPGTEAPSS